MSIKKTKIVATLGPASNTKERILELVQNGTDVFRLNFSHGSHEDHKNVYKAVREVEEIVNHPIGILADLQGPKLRVGTFKNGPETLDIGDSFSLHLDPVDGDKSGVTLAHPEIFSVVKKGDTLLINDGKISLSITEVSEKIMECKVTVGGEISDRKGVNVPNAVLPISALTEKDIKDLNFALELGVDWIALSFVQKPQDMEYARKLVGEKAKILAKLEKPSAIEYLDEIIALSDAIMVARGDLGVECPPEDVPVIQKRIVQKCRNQGKPVIVATQMLESMITAPVPTRAEVNDVANAIFDGADAIMLSAETAAGQNPIEAVAVMKRIAKRIESDTLYHDAMEQTLPKSHDNNTDTISSAVQSVISNTNCKNIAAFTATGTTAVRIARLRPDVPILALTPSIKTARWLNLVWGCYAIKTKNITNDSEITGKATRISRQHHFAKNGDTIVVTAGLPFGTPGAANLLQIATVGQYEKDLDSDT